jgi:uncharacterized delta-60 repeat protein
LTQLLSATYIGGSERESGGGLVVDSGGSVYYVDSPTSEDFPTTSGAAYEDASFTESQPTKSSVSKFSNDLSTLIASTYVPGIEGTAIKLDSSGNVFIAGVTLVEELFTTEQSFDGTFNGVYDAVVAKLSNDLSTVIEGTYIGGDYYENPAKWSQNALAIDSSDNVFLGGETQSTDFPTTEGAYDTEYADYKDSFIVKLDNDLHNLLASTYLGGDNTEEGCSIKLDSEDNVYFTAYTDSSSFYNLNPFPTTEGAYQEGEPGEAWGGDTFVSKFSSDLTTLMASTYLGGPGDGGEFFSTIDIDSDGNVYIAGITTDEDFPVTSGAYDTTYNGNDDADGSWDYIDATFISKLDANLSTYSLDHLKTSSPHHYINDDFESGWNSSVWSTTYDSSAYMGAESSVYAAEVSSDEKIFIGGDFTMYNDTSINRIARINPDGSLDTSFDPGTGADGRIYAMEMQSDGKIIIGGSFTSYNGTSINRIARINPDGSLDTGFDPGSGVDKDIHAMEMQSDGKIVIGGYFTSYNGTSINKIARINPDGSLDTFFDPGTGASSYVRSIKIQTDDKIMIGGSFTSYNGTSTNRIARINPDGSLDANFDSGSGASSTVRSINVRPDEKILIGGYFTTYNDISRDRIARINPDGTLDNSFDPDPGLSGGVFDIDVQSDDKILVSGASLIDRGGFHLKGLARLSASGVDDSDFNPGTPVVSGWSVIEGDEAYSGSNALYSAAYSSTYNLFLNAEHTFSSDGQISFYWKTRAGQYDALKFCLDIDPVLCEEAWDGGLDTYTKRTGFNTDWELITIPVSSGSHEISWHHYRYDSTDEAWLDNIRFTELLEEDNAISGQGKLIRITAVNTEGGIYEQYSGEKNMTFSGLSTTSGVPTATDKDGVDVPFGSPTTLTFEKGIAETEITAYTKETAPVNLTDGVYNSMGDDAHSLNLTVTSSSGGGSSPTSPDDDPATEDEEDTSSDETDDSNEPEPAPEEEQETSSETEEETEDEDSYIELEKSKDGKLAFDVKVEKDSQAKSESIKKSKNESTEIRNISLKTKKDEEAEGELEIESKEELPEELDFPSELKDCLPLQINEVTADFSSSHIKEAEMIYRIPKGWLDKVESGRFTFSHNSRVKEKNKWAKLLTSSLVSFKNDEYIYKVSSEELKGWWGVHVCGESAESYPEEDEESPESITRDIDNDGNNETATDTNNNPVDGYENFSDPDNSSEIVISIDVDYDAKIDHLIDTDGDNSPDIFWDPDDNTVTETTPLDVDGDSEEERLIDTDGDDDYDYCYDSEEDSIKIVNNQATNDVDSDGQEEHIINVSDEDGASPETAFDPDQSSSVIVEIKPDQDNPQSYLIDTDQDQEPDVYWNSENNFVTELKKEDVDQDKTEELIFGIESSNNYDRYYDPDDRKVKAYQQENEALLGATGTLLDNLRNFVKKQKTALNTAVASGLAISLLPMLLQLNSGRDLGLILKEFLLRFFGILGWRRRKEKDWGVVYDANSGAPLSFTQVQIVDKKTGKVKETKITDKHGTYYFLASPGSYVLKCFKNGYKMVSSDQKNKLKAFYGNSYFGGKIEREKNSKIYYDIPLVKKGESFTQKLSTQEKLAFIATLAFWIGLAVNLTVVFTAPSVLNWLILIAYIYLVFVRHIMIGGKEWGIVLNSNNKPMPFTVIKLIDSNKNQMYARAVSDEKGRYMMIGKPGKYSLEGSANGERLSFKPSLLSIRKRKAIKEELVGN